MMALSSYFPDFAYKIPSLIENSSDLDYPYDYRCNATFKADPDIAGPGVSMQQQVLSITLIFA
jgi:hypothetical protein